MARYDFGDDVGVEEQHNPYRDLGEIAPTVDFSKSRYDFTALDNIPRQPSTQGSDRIISAKLFLFSPKMYGQHMVRPHVYDFNDANALQVMHQAFINDNPMVSRPIVAAEPGVLSMIQPATTGHNINLGTLSNFWTFMLVVESVGVSSLTSYMSVPIFKNVSIGYCIDEPISFQTGQVNPGCVLKFTHHDKFQYRKNHYGGDNGFSVKLKQNHDVIPSEYRNMSYSPDGSPALVKLSPYALRGVDPQAMAMYEFHGDTAALTRTTVQPILTPGESAQISSTIKYTPAHLRVFTDNLIKAKNLVADGSIFSHYAENSRIKGDDLSSVFYELMNEGDILVNNGIGTWDVKRLMDLTMMDLPMIEILPIRTENPRNWEVYPSTEINARNVYNAWISDTISQLCGSYGITEISFVYDSYTGNQFEREGRWQLHHLETVHGADRNMTLQAFNEFKMMLENDLFQVMKCCVGEFMLQVTYRMISDTIVNLVLKDFNDNVTANYEHPIQFGGLICPNIGTSDKFMSNCLEAQNLIHKLEV